MVTITDHPLITHKLGIIRSADTGTTDFRRCVNEIAALMAYEISRDLPVREKIIETPLATLKGGEIATEIILVPVLRAGLGMVDGIERVFPDVRVAHIGIYRNHKTLEPVTYYSKIPDNPGSAVVMVLDPMLATGGSAAGAITILKRAGAERIKLVSIVGAPEGVSHIERSHPDVDIYLAALDERLDEKGYIIPGLGDAGDRIFGTQ